MKPKKSKKTTKYTLNYKKLQFVTKDDVFKFWEKWEQADEIDKLKMCAKLAEIMDMRIAPSGEKTRQFLLASGLNSYLKDLWEYCLRKYDKNRGVQSD